MSRPMPATALALARCSVRLGAFSCSAAAAVAGPAVHSSYRKLPARVSYFSPGVRTRSKGIVFIKHRTVTAAAPWLPPQRTVHTMATVATPTQKPPASEQDAPPESTYQMPPAEIAAIVDAEPSPNVSISPQRNVLIYLHRPSLPSIAELARPELRLAGLRIDPDSNSRSRMTSYTKITVADLGSQGFPTNERPLVGLPAGAKLNYVSWSPDGKHIAFSVRASDEEEQARGKREPLSLWVANVATCTTKPLMTSPQFQLNNVFGSFDWVDSETLVVYTIPAGRGQAPTRPLAPVGPNIQDHSGGKAVQARTYPDLLKDVHDERLFDYYGTSQLVLANIDGTATPIGEPQMYTRADPSPDGQFMIVETKCRPYSFLVPSARFPKKVEVWDAKSGRVVRELANLPLAEDIPIAWDSVRAGPRSIYWRPDKPSTIYWVETQDGGDAKVEVSPRDIVYVQSVGKGAEEKPTELAKLTLRYNGIVWGDDDLAIVYETWYKTRKSVSWTIAPGNMQQEPRVLYDRMYEDVYTDPGGPLTRRNEYGADILAMLDSPDTGNRQLLYSGTGATPKGNRPFLDVLDLESRQTQRIWQSGPPDGEFLEFVASTVCTDTQKLTLDNLPLLVCKQSQKDPAQYYTCNDIATNATFRQITDFPHPHPQLKGLQKEVVRYEREDGCQLTANLYLPPGYEPKRDGPLRTLLWAYPREFKNKEAAGQNRSSPNEFSSIGPSSPLLWLARGYCILDGPTMPIIGEGDQEPNETYVEQLTASAKAAVDEVIRRGVAHPGQITVAGHSYGAFMTANLLAHAPELFCCGVACSGAYNRTLTPFGFQSEDRTLWQATDTYINMSPFMKADKITKPLLLMHGEDDNNTGTFPMQSERFFAALKGHSAVTRLVLLPHESHGYRARESIMHQLWEMCRWMEMHGKADVTSNENGVPKL
eukprot:jgi/Chlat1/8740/Chrsp9S08567